MQRVLITAGAKGIGLAIARRFAAAGARVHVLDIDAAAVAAAAAIPGVSGGIADMADAEALGPAVGAAVAALGGLDVLVNNAGIAGPTAPVETFPLEGWRAVMDVNLTGTFAVTAAAIQHLKASERGAIVVLSSLAGRCGFPNRSAYAASKWGVIGFAKTLAMELGPFGITCNAILPGPVAGPRIEGVLRDRAAANGTSVEAERQGSLRNQSIARFIDAADIAELAFFLAGPAARTISGQTFPIDGDAKSSV